jgi:hypothetical protein
LKGEILIEFNNNEKVLDMKIFNNTLFMLTTDGIYYEKKIK